MNSDLYRNIQSIQMMLNSNQMELTLSKGQIKKYSLHSAKKVKGSLWMYVYLPRLETQIIHVHSNDSKKETWMHLNKKGILNNELYNRMFKVSK